MYIYSLHVCVDVYIYMYIYICVYIYICLAYMGVGGEFNASATGKSFRFIRAC